MKKRLFIALDISDEARDSATQYIQQMAEKFNHVAVKWERPEKLHLTLKFLGSVEEHLISKIIDLVDRTARATKPFTIEIRGTGTFPSAKNPQVLWLGVHESTSAMKVLAKHIDESCAEVGFEQQKRTFKPHLTLGRIRDQQGAAELGKQHVGNTFDPINFLCRELVIYESHLGRSGSIYEKLHTSRFNS